MDIGDEKPSEMEVDDLDLEPLPRERSNTWHGTRVYFDDHQPPKFPAISEKTSSFNSNEEGDEEDDHLELKSTLEGHKPSQNSSESSSPATLTNRRNSMRRNAWGNASYAELITQAIESVPDKRLTLMQIYDWMIQNVPYFQERADGASSMGWKNSVRHNLSLHDQFSRVQNEGTGKSSWWVVNRNMLKPRITRARRATMGDPILLDSKRIKVSKKLKNAEFSCSGILLDNGERDEEEDDEDRFRGESERNSLSNFTPPPRQNNRNNQNLDCNETGLPQNIVSFFGDDKNTTASSEQFSDDGLELISDKVATTTTTTMLALNNETFHQQQQPQQQKQNDQQSSGKAQLINALWNRQRIKSLLSNQQEQQQQQKQQQQKLQLHQQQQTNPQKSNPTPHSTTSPGLLPYVICTSVPIAIQHFNNNNNINIHSNNNNKNNNNYNGSINNNNSINNNIGNNISIAKMPNIDLQPTTLQINFQQQQHLQLQGQLLQQQQQLIQLRTQPIQLQIQQQEKIQQHVQIQQQQQQQTVELHPHQILLQPQLQIQPILQQQQQQQHQLSTGNIILKVQTCNNQINTLNATNNSAPIVLYLTPGSNNNNNNNNINISANNINNNNSSSSNNNNNNNILINQTSQQFILTRKPLQSNSSLQQQIPMHQQSLEQQQLTKQQQPFSMQQNNLQQQQNKIDLLSDDDSKMINKYINVDLKKKTKDMKLVDGMGEVVEVATKSEDVVVEQNKDGGQDISFQQQQFNFITQQQLLQQRGLMSQQQEQQQIDNLQESQNLDAYQKRQKMLLNLLHSEKFCELRRRNPEFNNKIIEILKKKKEMLEATTSQQQQVQQQQIQQQQPQHEKQQQQSNSNSEAPLQQLININEQRDENYAESKQTYPTNNWTGSYLNFMNDEILNSTPIDDDKSCKNDHNPDSSKVSQEKEDFIGSSDITIRDNSIDANINNCNSDDDDDSEQMPTTTTTNFVTLPVDDDVVDRVINDMNFDESIDELFDVNSLLNCDDDNDISQSFSDL